MHRRILCSAALVLLGFGGLQAQTLSYSPLNPRHGDLVTFTISTYDCFASLDTALAPPGPGNGSIRFTITQGCDCVSAARPISFNEEVGPLAFGSYDIKLYQQYRYQGDACCEEGDCTPPELLLTSTLTVSRNGGLLGLRTEPPHPVAGQPLTVRFETFCPFVWQAPRIQAAGNETLIFIDEHPEAPQPGAPCTTDAGWSASFPLAGLPAGTYRLRVRMGESSATLETVAETVFAVVPAGPALALRQGRFRIWADWSAPDFGQGSAQSAPLTDESGYFTFFGPTNVELIVKVLHGCPVNQHYWIFIAGLTNVEATVHVEDTLTGRLETYSNPLGRPFQPVMDTSSFATCP